MRQSSNGSSPLPLSLGQVFAELATTPDGLSSQAAQERLQASGFNEITANKPHLLLKLFGFFLRPIPWIIEIAAILRRGGSQTRPC
jgi:H+-transporting ATPase